jgi:hypothetical protein
MKLRPHTATLINWLPASALGLGLLGAYAMVRAPAAKPLVSVALWLITGGFGLFWLTRDRRERGYRSSRWLSFGAVLPLFQIVPLSYYLIRTRGGHSGALAVLALVVLAAIFLLAFGAGFLLGKHILEGAAPA